MTPFRPAVPPLTPMELEVLAGYANGGVDHTVGASLGISPNTVKWHTKRIRRRLGVRTTTHAVANAIRKGWIE